MRVRAPDISISLEELKLLIRKHKERGRELIVEIKKLEAHFDRMNEYYEQWEDDILAINKEIDKLKVSHGITIEQVEEYDALKDIMGDLA